MARIQEAKDIPIVSVIDAPGIPEKKAFPPRLLITLFLTFLAFATASALILARNYWSTMHPDDPRRALAEEIVPVLRRRSRSILRWKRAPHFFKSREESKS
jgi:hypothetical protein